MRIPTDNVRKYLNARYRDVYGADFAFAETLDLATTRPALIPVSARALSPKGAGIGDALLVADPDIAVLLYLLPLASIEDVPTVISKATALRSQLLPVVGSPAAASQNDSSWSIVLHWLTDSAVEHSKWMARLAELRLDAAHSEEVPVDILIATDGNWDRALERHGIPRLLLHVRRILDADNPQAIEKWLSADDALHEALIGFDRKLKLEAQRELARQITERFSKMQAERLATSTPSTDLSG